MALGNANPKRRRERPAGRSADGVPWVLAYADEPRRPWWSRPRFLAAAVVMCVALRLLVAGVSFGTNDAATFLRFGIQVDAHGLLAAYRLDLDLNHPPIPIAWAWAAYRLTDGGPAFPFVFKLPVIAVEAATAWLLWRRWREARAGRIAPDGAGTDKVGGGPPPAAGDARRAALAAGGYALSLCAILVSGYHCNTDTVYAALCLLSVWLLEARGRPLAAGLALAAAINVKLIPVLLIPGLLLSLRTRREAVRFTAGLAAGVLPFIPVLLAVGPSFYRNALAYGSNLDKWGVPFFLLPADDIPALPDMAAAIAYHTYAKYPLLALLVGWAAAARRLGRWDRYEVAAATFALFLVFAPGYGVQYAPILVPLMFAVRPGVAAVYSLASGAFLAAVYALTLKDGFPLYSEYNSLFPQPSPWLGAVAWGVLVYFAAVVLFRPAPKPAAG